MKGEKVIWRAPGASRQPYPTFKCGRNVKVKGAVVQGFDVDVGFNIPTA